MGTRSNNKSQPQASKTKKKNESLENTKYYIPLFFILLVSFIVYLPVLHNSFVNADDDLYIQNNPLIRSINFKEIFSRYDMGNYHPLTMLIYSIEYRLFGLSEKGFHAINLMFHLLNVILAFHVVLLLVDNVKVALITSLLFGIHPIHVESVAWVSELKDLLYVFFFLASYTCYLKYLKNSQRKYIYYCFLLFLLSLLSKALAVTLPVIVLLTDYFKGRKLTGSSIAEKIPFIFLSVIFGAVAVLAQRSYGAIHMDYFGLPQRLVFSSYGYITYLIKLLFPFNLCSFYPYPDMPVTGSSLPAQYYIYVFLFFGLAASVFYSLRFTRKIFFGIGFFTITVLLVLQLLPVGGTIMADRYAYLPSLGIFYLASEGILYLWNKKGATQSLRMPVVMVFAIAAIFYSAKTYSQCGVWKNSMTLWTNVINQYQKIPDAYYNRGYYLVQEKRYEEALKDINKTIELDPDYYQAYNIRGNILNGYNQHEQALDNFNKAIALKPEASTYNNRGLVFRDLQRYQEAINDFNKAILLNPLFYEAFNDRGIVLSELKRFDEALNDFNKAINLDPENSTAYYNRGATEYNMGNKEIACTDFQQAANLGHPDAASTYARLCQ
jgi:Flp pilus assembly protein TadD